MSDRGNSHLNELKYDDLAKFRRADQICDAYERAWLEGRRPHLEDYLARAPEAERGNLERELKAVKCDYERRPQQLREVPTLEDTLRHIDSATGGTDHDHPTQISRFRIDRLLGAGGFGRVYLAQDEELGRLVAIKVPHARVLARLGDARTYLAEARAAANLDHPGIVPVYDVGRTRDFPCYIVSKYVEGTDLSTLLKKQRLKYREAAELVATVAEALHYAHTRGLVHRDVKPGNILIGLDAQPYVLDFGLALREEDVGKGPKHAGTPAYMSPEQARGEGHRVDGRSDVFSLGVVFYELLAGRRPFRADTPAELIEQVTSYDPRPLRQYDEKLPKELARICHKALAKRASERYSSAHDMVEDLRLFLAEQTMIQSHASSGGVASVAAGAHASTSVGDAAASSPLPDAGLSGSRPIKIVPKGLRSFDAHDAGFFLELLPGPRDRDGLPDSLRFWKTRIEETDPDNTFSVGLIYGPSGCGKSSLVKAGLLPRLSEDVILDYIEATPEETETRLLNGLRKRCPALEDNLSLKETLAALRRGQGIPVGKKVLIVLDQFEQWLHAKKEDENTDLVQALRQCDGGRVQCIVMVRDDFWMAATRFMRELEVRLVEAQNSAAVDSFPIRHAEKVLAAFGRAFGTLPDNISENTKDQKEFIKHSVAGLAEEGKVICVRLALFAEMMKGKTWTPATLREVGGTKGVGVAFLEETFSASTSPPEHRYHQKAARAVLKLLLPDSGTDIKGAMRSYSELLQASGYGNRPKDFDDLIRILDREIRLITPTDPEGKDADDDSVTQTEAGQKYFQLTHDYLVHSLREWLTRKQQETRKGRAELKLAERAAAYQAKPDPRHLPGWWEWPNILLFTRRRAWTPAERRMMRSATRRRSLQALLAAVLVATASFSGLELRRRVAEDRQRTLANGTVQRLLDAPLASAVAIAAELESYRAYSDPQLRASLAPASNATDAQRLRAALGLLEVDPSQAQTIYDALLAAPADEARVLIGVLKGQREQWIKPLWKHLADSKSPPTLRLRAAMALAAYDPPNSPETRERWRGQAPFVIDQFLAEARQDPSAYEPLLTALEPAAAALLAPLGVVFRNAERNATERELATTLLTRYAASNPDELVELVCDAQPEQFLVLFPVLEKHGDKAVKLLAGELERKAAPDWRDSPLDPAWSELPAEVAARLEAADGLVAERFAFCQTLPLDEFEGLAARMKNSGYRPIRLRPYLTSDGVRTAAVWRRDGLEWRMAEGLTAEELMARDKQLRPDEYLPADVAGYRSATLAEAQQSPAGIPEATQEPSGNAAGSESGPSGSASAPGAPSRIVFSAIWTKETTEPENVRLYADLESPYTPEIKALESQGFAAAAIHPYRDGAAGLRYTVILRKSAANDWYGSKDQHAYEAEVATDRLEIDVSICEGDLQPPVRPDPVEQLALAEKAVGEKPDDVDALYRRGLARYHAGDDGGAIEDLTAVAEKLPQYSGCIQFRAQAHARLQHAEQARADVKKFAELGGAPGSAAYLDCIVSARLDDEDAGLARLEAGVTQHLQDPGYLYDAACASVIVSGIVAEKHPERCELLRTRALELLSQAVEQGYEDFDHMRTDDDLAELRERDAFQAIVARGQLERRYAAVFETSATTISTELHGLSPSAHSARCRELLALGYRPAALSVAEIVAPGENAPSPVAASVWHLPQIEDADKERIALRQANAGAALVRLGQAERVWPLLAHRPDPRVRSWLVHRLAPLDADPNRLIARLFSDVAPPGAAGAAMPRGGAAAGSVTATEESLFDPETSLRRALLLALGEFDEAALPPPERAKLLPRLIELYRSDPDAGVHAAAAWLSRRWGAAAKLAEIDDSLQRAKAPASGKRWYVNSQGQTMVVVAGPIEFLMGSPADEPGRETAFESLHRRRIGRSFVIGAHEVTVDQVKQWQANFSYSPQYASTGECPMNAVSWYAAAAYCNWLSEQEGLQRCYETNAQGQYAEGMRPAADYLSRSGYRLPTEAEWEFACRAGAVTSRYYGASEALFDQYACYLGNSQDRLFEVGSLKPNDLGFFDMLGNVYEWCGDLGVAYADRRLDRAADDAGNLSALNDKAFRVLRGAAFNVPPSFVRSANRLWFNPSYRYNSLGFRVARTYR